MSKARSAERYTLIAIILHWVMAIGIVALVVIGLAMSELDINPARSFQLYQLHKSIGITVLLAAFLRLVWRLMHRPPELPDEMPPIERKAASGVHILLYVMLFALPLTGWALVSASPLNIPTVLYGIVPWPHLPILPTLKNKESVETALAYIHTYGAWFLIVLVIIHAAAALRHHFVLRDEILSRMIPALRRKSSEKPAELS